MAVKQTTLLIAASALALGACSDTGVLGGGGVLNSWTKEAGSFLDEGQFGNPTMNNTAVHSGSGNIVVDLNNRFAAEVSPMVNFAFDSAVIDAEAAATLREQANWIRQFPEVRFKVFGHTDLVGPNAYNKSLGLRRARAVVNFLVRQGVDRRRLQAVSSFGETQPLIVTQDRERRNRRTITEVSGFVKNTSGPLHGKYAELIFREYVGAATAGAATADADTAAE